MEEKHDAFLKIWMPNRLKRVLQDLAEMDDRKTSDYICNVLEDHAFGRQRRLCEIPREGADRAGVDRQ